MKQYLKLFICASICAFVLTAGKGTESISNLILAYGFESVQILAPYITEMTFWYMPLLLFQILYGTFIYRHFCTAGVYFFSRKNKRVRWFLIEAAKLYLYAFAYLLIMLLCSIGMMSVLKKTVYDRGTFLLAVYYLLIHSLFLFVTTLVINLLAILFSSLAAFVITEGICMLEIGFFVFQGEYPGEAYVLSHPWMIHCNPVSHLILWLHESRIEAVDRLIHREDIGLDLNHSVLLYLVIAILLLCAGCVIVKKYDFVGEQRTEGE